MFLLNVDTELQDVQQVRHDPTIKIICMSVQSFGDL